MISSSAMTQPSLFALSNFPGSSWTEHPPWLRLQHQPLILQPHQVITMKIKLEYHEENCKPRHKFGLFSHKAETDWTPNIAAPKPF